MDDLFGLLGLRRLLLLDASSSRTFNTISDSLDAQRHPSTRTTRLTYRESFGARRRLVWAYFLTRLTLPMLNACKRARERERERERERRRVGTGVCGKRERCSSSEAMKERTASAASTRYCTSERRGCCGGRQARWYL